MTSCIPSPTHAWSRRDAAGRGRRCVARLLHLQAASAGARRTAVLALLRQSAFMGGLLQ
jgi:hypothetical protein